MGLDDRLTLFLLGCFLGFVLGYLVRSLREIKESVDKIKHDVGHEDRDERGYSTSDVFVHVSLVVVLILTAWASVASQLASNKLEESQKQIIVSFCESGQDSRAVQRQLVDAVYNLAVGSTERDLNAPPLSDKRLKMYNDFIDRVNNFRSSTYEQIQPPHKCAPYVDDFNVKPPTPPVPHITQ
jgi:hypothetical protein